MQHRKSHRGKYFVVAGVGGALVLTLVTLAVTFWPPSRKAARPLTVRLDATGPYLILATTRAAKDYGAAIQKAEAVHPGAERVDFDPAGLDKVLDTLQKIQPRYALVFIQPDELDVNFAWRWLAMASKVDDDPLVDVRTGFITGGTPEAALAFVDRIADAASGRIRLPGALVDNLGPSGQGTPFFNEFSGAMMLPAKLGERVAMRTIAHGTGNFTDDKIASMDGAGIVHFGGHGHPDRVDDGLTASQVARLKLAPCVVFNGACYTGVTNRWFDETTGKVTQKAAAMDCFCLKLLEKNVVGYLAAVHPDHGMPVYQEMEFLGFQGASLGEVMKHTHDGVIMGAGGKLPEFKSLVDGTPVSARTPADVMLCGTAARLLLGDPATIVCEACLAPPFTVKTTVEGETIRVRATLTNADLKSTFTDTYYNDLNPQAPFNDRAMVSVELPKEWTSVSKVEVASVKAGGKTMPHRLVGHAIERDQGKNWLHVQIDVPAQGFQQSVFRVRGAAVEFVVSR